MGGLAQKSSRLHVGVNQRPSFAFPTAGSARAMEARGHPSRHGWGPMEPPIRVTTVADVMVRHPKLCREDSTAGEVRRLFADDHVHAVLLVSAGQLLTVIERSDIRPETTDSELAVRLGHLSGRVTAAATPADSALDEMIAADQRRLAVVGPDGLLLGLLCVKRSGRGFCSDEDVRRRRPWPATTGRGGRQVSPRADAGDSIAQGATRATSLR